MTRNKLKESTGNFFLGLVPRVRDWITSKSENVTSVRITKEQILDCKKAYIVNGITEEWDWRPEYMENYNARWLGRGRWEVTIISLQFSSAEAFSVLRTWRWTVSGKSRKNNAVWSDVSWWRRLSPPGTARVLVSEQAGFCRDCLLRKAGLLRSGNRTCSSCSSTFTERDVSYNCKPKIDHLLKCHGEQETNKWVLEYKFHSMRNMYFW